MNNDDDPNSLTAPDLPTLSTFVDDKRCRTRSAQAYSSVLQTIPMPPRRSRPGLRRSPR
jgi:hypothetical protein